MATYEQTVQSELELLEDEEILAKLRSDSLTDVAARIAASVLVKRGREVPILTDAQRADDAGKNGAIPAVSRLRTFIFRCAKGQSTLMAAFWFGGAGLMLFTGALLATHELIRTRAMVSVLVDVIGILWIVAMVFHAVCVWRCAKNTRIYAFGQLAKVYAALQIGLWLVLVLVLVLVPVIAIAQRFASM